jgi:hypothetical protein
MLSDLKLSPVGVVLIELEGTLLVSAGELLSVQKNCIEWCMTLEKYLCCFSISIQTTVD